MDFVNFDFYTHQIVYIDFTNDYWSYSIMICGFSNVSLSYYCLLLAGDEDLDGSNTDTSKRRSHDHITSTLQLKSESHTATDIGLNWIVDVNLLNW